MKYLYNLFGISILALFLFVGCGIEEVENEQTVQTTDVHVLPYL